MAGRFARYSVARQPYGYHPLAPRLLAGMVIRDKRRSGDIQVASRYPVLPDLKGKEQHHMLQVSYDALDRQKRALLLGYPVAALAATRQAPELADEVASTIHPVERDFVRAEWLLGWPLVALGLLDEAKPHLTEALTRCHRINMVDLEPDILLAWARWHRAKNEPGEALHCAQEALTVADRCEGRLA